MTCLTPHLPSAVNATVALAGRQQAVSLQPETPIALRFPFQPPQHEEVRKIDVSSGTLNGVPLGQIPSPGGNETEGIWRDGKIPLDADAIARLDLVNRFPRLHDRLQPASGMAAHRG